MGWISRISLDPLCSLGLNRLINHLNLAWLSIEFEKYSPNSIGTRLTDSQEFHDQAFAGLDVDGEFLPNSRSVKENRRWQ